MQHVGQDLGRTRPRTIRLPWQWVLVRGPSMVPTLRDGDRALARHGAVITSGDVVLATFRSLPGRFVVKRAVVERDGGWWLRSDNRYAGGDSQVHGVADVHARIGWVVRGRRLRRVR